MILGQQILSSLTKAQQELTLALGVIRDHGESADDAFLENDILRALGATEDALANWRNRG